MICEGQRDFHFVDFGLDVVELPQHLFPFFGRGQGKHAVFERYQFTVPSVDARLDSPVIYLRHRFQTRDQQDDDLMTDSKPFYYYIAGIPHHIDCHGMVREKNLVTLRRTAEMPVFRTLRILAAREEFKIFQAAPNV